MTVTNLTSPSPSQLEEALSEARKGLFRIANIDPTTFVKYPATSKNLGIVKAFKEAQETAERTLLNMSDVENADG